MDLDSWSWRAGFCEASLDVDSNRVCKDDQVSKTESSEVLMFDSGDADGQNCRWINVPLHGPGISIMISTIMLLMTITVSMISEMTMMMTMCFANHRGFGPLPKFNSTSVSWIPHHGWLIEIWMLVRKYTKRWQIPGQKSSPPSNNGMSRCQGRGKYFYHSCNWWGLIIVKIMVNI